MTTVDSGNVVRDGVAVRYGIPFALLASGAVGWWWSVHMSGEMRSSAMDMRDPMSAPMGAAAFLVAWLAMMAAMMLPAIVPVVKLYARASARGRLAPLPFFVAGYLVVWTLLGVPAYFAWRALDTPRAQGAHWVARLAGAVLVTCGVWQFTPLKELCLRQCRSPMSVFLRHGRRLERRRGAAGLGATHGLYCVGCCWAIFALLVALGTMNIGWMLILTALIVAEKTAPRGHRTAVVTGAIFVILGIVFLAAPGSYAAIT